MSAPGRPPRRRPPRQADTPALTSATTPATTIKTLAELGALRKALQRSAREAAEQAARAQAADLDRVRALAAQHDLFARTVGPVHRLPDSGLAEIDLPRPPPYPRQRELDEAAALAESLSDEVNLESLLLTDDGLSFRRPGIGPDVVIRLRRGQWALQGEIDLHGHTQDEAFGALARFLETAGRRRWLDSVILPVLRTPRGCCTLPTPAITVSAR